MSLRIDRSDYRALRVNRVTIAGGAGEGSVEIQVAHHQARGLDKCVLVRDAGGRGIACYLPPIIDCQPNGCAAQRAEVLHGNGLRFGGNCQNCPQYHCSANHAM